MFGSIQGGNDHLKGGAGDDWLYGDGGTGPQGPALTEARQMSAGAEDDSGGQMAEGTRGGDDHLYGGGGCDHFAYAGDPESQSSNEKTFGNDRVYDFHQGEDMLVFRLYENLGMDDLRITRKVDSTIVALPEHGTIELLGFAGTLIEADFLFMDW